LRAVEIGFAEGEAAEEALGLGLELKRAEFGKAALRFVVFLGVGLAGAAPSARIFCSWACSG